MRFQHLFYASRRICVITLANLGFTPQWVPTFCDLATTNKRSVLNREDNWSLAPINTRKHLRGIYLLVNIKQNMGHCLKSPNLSLRFIYNILS